VTAQVEEYLRSRQQKIAFPLRLYGLVDELLYRDHAGGSPLSRSSSRIALFDGTPDEALAHAGPWLLDCSADHDSYLPALHRMGNSATGCIWIVSAYAPEDLAAALRARLNVRMPSGAIALLRYYDARITSDIIALLTPVQLAAFFAPVLDWLIQRDGILTRIYQSHGT